MTTGCSKYAALSAVAVTLWLAAAAHAQTTAPVEGTYCLRGVHEVGSCLRLAADSKFEYFLAYGAYDEKSEGHWNTGGTDVVLDSPPYDKAPAFTFKGFQAAEGDGFDIVVVNKGGNPINGVNVRATCDGRSFEVGVTGTGYRVDCKSAPTEVALGLEMFGVAYQIVPVSVAAGADKAYVFGFDPGDLGKKRFASQRFSMEVGTSLTAVYADTPIRELTGRTFRYTRQQQ